MDVMSDCLYFTLAYTTSPDLQLFDSPFFIEKSLRWRDIDNKSESVIHMPLVFTRNNTVVILHKCLLIIHNRAVSKVSYYSKNKVGVN